MSNENSKKEEKEDNGHGQQNQLNVQVRYQSDVVPVQINANASIEALLAKAINATGNNSIPKERFQLKLGATVLDTHKKVNDYPIIDGTLLVLCLIAGGGGNY